MTMPPAYYITTPIYYVNDSPHIGHAYTSLSCDVLARFMRADGYKVMFLTGTDEHGQKVEKSAKESGVPPQEFVDIVSKKFIELGETMNFSNNDFIRTTENRHINSCKELWKRISKNNAPETSDSNIYLGKYSGWYSVRDEAFYAEKELVKKSNSQTYVAPTGAPVEWVEEPSYFFRLSAWQEPLLKFYKENPHFIAPETRRNEVLSFVSSGLQDLSISRTSFSWGVQVPDDESHIMYVWLDALTNYITATGFPNEKEDKWKQFWPASLHMVGKDILRFHTVYWPAFLMAAGLEPPKRIYAHGWWTNEGQKISKSLGNVIDPRVIVERYGIDAVRYFLLREVPFGKDGDFSHKSMITRINNDLANDLGNLAQRTLSMIAKNCNSKIPKIILSENSNFDSLETLREARELINIVRNLLHKQLFNEALESIWEVIRSANRSIDKDEPWKLRKTNSTEMESVLWIHAEILRTLGIILLPFMPDAMNSLLNQLCTDENKRAFSYISNIEKIYDEYSLKPGVTLPKPAPIFPRYIEDS